VPHLPAMTLGCASPRSCASALATGKRRQCISMSESVEAWKGDVALQGYESLLQHGKGGLAEIQTSRGQSQEVRESARVLCTYYKITDYFSEGCYDYKVSVIVPW